MLEVATNDHGDEYNSLLADKIQNGKNNQYRKNQTVPLGKNLIHCVENTRSFALEYAF